MGDFLYCSSYGGTDGAAEAEELSEGGPPRTNASELTDHILDCAAFFPRHLLWPAASIATIRCCPEWPDGREGAVKAQGGVSLMSVGVEGLSGVGEALDTGAAQSFAVYVHAHLHGQQRARHGPTAEVGESCCCNNNNSSSSSSSAMVQQQHSSVAPVVVDLFVLPLPRLSPPVVDDDTSGGHDNNSSSTCHQREGDVRAACPPPSPALTHLVVQFSFFGGFTILRRRRVGVDGSVGDWAEAQRDDAGHTPQPASLSAVGCSVEDMKAAMLLEEGCDEGSNGSGSGSGGAVYESLLSLLTNEM